MPNTIAKIFLVTVLLDASSAQGTLRVAAIFPEPTAQMTSVGNEAACIAKGLIAQAKQQGLNVTLEIVPNQRDASSAVKAAHQIIAGKYDVALGTFASSEAIPAAQLFEEAKIPFIVPTASHVDITKGKSFVLRLPFNDLRQADLLAAFTVKELKPVRIAVVKNLSQPNSEFLAQEFAKSVKKRKPSIQLSEHSLISGDDRFAELVAQILAQKPEVIFVPLSSVPAAKIYAELFKQNAKLTLLGADSIGGRGEFFDAVGATSPNLKFFFVKHWNGTAQGPLAASYTELFKKYCAGAEHTMITVATHDAVALLLKAHAKRPAARGADLISLARRTKFTGLTGELKFGEDKDPLKPLQLYKIEGDKSLFWKAYP